MNSFYAHIAFAQRTPFLLSGAIARNVGGDSLTLPATSDRRIITPLVRRSVLFLLPLPLPPRQTTRRGGLCFLNVPLRHFLPDFIQNIFGHYTDFDHFASPQDDHRDKKNSNRVPRRIICTSPRTAGESPQLMGVGKTFVLLSGRVGRFVKRFLTLKWRNANCAAETGQIGALDPSGKAMQHASTPRNGKTLRRLQPDPFLPDCNLSRDSWKPQTRRSSALRLRRSQRLKSNYAKGLEVE